MRVPLALFVLLCMHGVASEVLPYAVVLVPSARSLANETGYLLKGVVHDMANAFEYFAHLYTVEDPVHHFSILPPKNGCGTIATPEETAEAFGGCDVATNGGFFRAEKSPHECLGAIVSDGAVIHRGTTQNAIFGIERLQNGSYAYFVGYMKIAEQQSRDWVQLVSGSVVLVKDQLNFVEQSIYYENFSIQETGRMEKWCTGSSTV